jgi:phosphatidylserine/phosphatidylglycerophosphate/cardiolipin synthase-like enzyme
MTRFFFSDRRRRRGRARRACRLGLGLLLACAVALVLSSAVGGSGTRTPVYYQVTEVEVVDRDFAGQLLFNDVPGGRALSDRVRAAMKRARRTLEVTMYSIDMVKLRREMEAARARGVGVELVLERSKREQHARLLAGGRALPVREVGSAEEDSGGYMHHKHTVVDRGQPGQTLLVGSLNYTTAQERHDPSFLLETGDAEVVRTFADENDRLRRGVHGYRKLRSPGYQPLQRRLRYRNGFVELWFGPGFKQNSVKYRMLELIAAAQRSIKVVVWQMTDRDIARALVAAAEAGVEVTVITDDRYLWSSESAFPRMVDRIRRDQLADIEIVSDLLRTVDVRDVNQRRGYFNPYIHQHTLIVDDRIVLSGSNNWTYNGFHRNDESVIVSDVPFWRDGFLASFATHYRELRGRRLSAALAGRTLVLRDPGLRGHRLHIYREVSGIDRTPAVCFEAGITSADQRFELPEPCVSLQSVGFVLDQAGRVVASRYLSF